ncbi:uncharacterized protein LOC126749028 [Anthonomus grandis grandis]|uniref:uncharacterized protein LOC126749028 n=1 Tax=Anthonomus grandis grandis TaxID=2921223 RepID=UPI0021668C9E|nr:uncharacterized protein LOC126749028 [Anthonomus grandis grandis]
MVLVKQGIKGVFFLLRNDYPKLYQGYRKCSDLSIVKTQLEVPTFCDIHLDLACKVRIKPLNINKYHNSNVFLLQTDMKYDNAIEHYIDGNKVIVKSHEKLNQNTLCSIKAPVKANLHVKSRNDVTIGFFHGDKLTINTEGNIFVDRFQGDTLDVTTTNGSIILNNYIQAANISATVTNGSISTGRLQGNNLKLKVIENGSLSVQSSYCNDSVFVVEKGNMELDNIHKNCKIFLVKGNLVLTGFDGQLSTILNSGSADVHLSRLTGDSNITLNGNGNLILRMADTCQDCTTLKIVSPNVDLQDIVRSEIEKTNDGVLLKPEVQSNNSMLVNCLKSDVKLKSTSWQEMIKMKVKNK